MAAEIDSHVQEEALGRLIDDPDFHLLNGRLDRFNLFDAVGGVRAELRHSNFLSFLFSPGRNHGLGSLPLERVLRAVLESVPPRERPVRTLQLVVGDLDDAVVHRERENFDLVIEVRSLNLVVLIENKIGAAAGDGQLARYRDLLERRYPEHRRVLVFLTPDGIEPDCPGYISFSYRRLAQTLAEIAVHEAAPAESKLILGHYVEMLRRHVVPDEDLQDLAQKLYERHREAFDFVFGCRPEPRGVLDALRSRIFGVEGLVEDTQGANSVRFVPQSWLEKLGVCRATAKWTGSGLGLVFELKAVPATGRIHLVLMMGPCEPQVRKHVYDEAAKRAGIFKGLVKPMGRQWATLFNVEIVTPTQAKALEYEALSTNASLAWSQFQGHDLTPLIQEVEAIAAMLGPAQPV